MAAGNTVDTPIYRGPEHEYRSGRSVGDNRGLASHPKGNSYVAFSDVGVN
jgi:hypothetical protein